MGRWWDYSLLKRAIPPGPRGWPFPGAAVFVSEGCGAALRSDCNLQLSRSLCCCPSRPGADSESTPLTSCPQSAPTGYLPPGTEPSLWDSWSCSLHSAHLPLTPPPGSPDPPLTANYPARLMLPASLLLQEEARDNVLKLMSNLRDLQPKGPPQCLFAPEVTVSSPVGG